jgi:hypothetical protein
VPTVFRTTGGLLQLKSKQVELRDFNRVVAFARGISDESARSSVLQRIRIQELQSHASRKVTSADASPRRVPVDLQVDIPAVFC